MGISLRHFLCWYTTQFLHKNTFSISIFGHNWLDVGALARRILPSLTDCCSTLNDYLDRFRPGDGNIHQFIVAIAVADWSLSFPEKLDLYPNHTNTVVGSPVVVQQSSQLPPDVFEKERSCSRLLPRGYNLRL